MDLKNKSLLKSESYIGGAWISTKSDKRFSVNNPVDDSAVVNVADCGIEETKAAIDAAALAFKAWSKTTADYRSKILKKWAGLMRENVDDLAMIMTMEQGKPLKESRGEIEYSAGFLEWFGEEARRVYGDVIPSPFENSRIVVIKQPVGVCATITPWNFPSAMIARKVGPALAAGCTVVSRPASSTPLSALAMAVLAEDAGVPAGVFNVITSADSKGIGQELCENPLVKKISFTGSTPVGKSLMKQSAETMKRVSFELGGNAPLIIFDDADLDEAVEGAVACKFRNAGQTCVCANRIYIQDGIYEEFATRFTKKVSALKVGRGVDEDVEIGPLIDDAAIEKVQEHINDAISKGAKVLTGGDLHDLGGTFFQPTVLKNMTQDMKIASEETFGPVAPLFRFKNIEQVIEFANATRYGLASYFYAKDLARVWHVAESLEYGMVAVNRGLLSTPVAPFGGVKESGLGREGSKYGMDEYIDTKYILMSGL